MQGQNAKTKKTEQTSGKIDLGVVSLALLNEQWRFNQSWVGCVHSVAKSVGFRVMQVKTDAACCFQHDGSYNIYA